MRLAFDTVKGRVVQDRGEGKKQEYESLKIGPNGIQIRKETYRPEKSPNKREKSIVRDDSPLPKAALVVPKVPSKIISEDPKKETQMIEQFTVVNTDD